MQEINIRNCPVVTIKTKTHNVVLASKEDVLNVDKVINDFFNKFEIIRVIPNVYSGELIKPQKSIETQPKHKLHNKRTSALAQYLQIKELLKDTFDAKDYHKALSTISNICLQSCYTHFKVLAKKGQIIINDTSPMTYTKIEKKYEPMPSMMKERKNLIDSFKT